VSASCRNGRRLGWDAGIGRPSVPAAGLVRRLINCFVLNTTIFISEQARGLHTAGHDTLRVGSSRVDGPESGRRGISGYPRRRLYSKERAINLFKPLGDRVWSTGRGEGDDRRGDRAAHTPRTSRKRGRSSPFGHGRLTKDGKRRELQVKVATTSCSPLRRRRVQAYGDQKVP